MDSANPTDRARARLRLQEWDSAFYSGDSAGTEDRFRGRSLNTSAHASSSSSHPSGSRQRRTADSQEGPASTLGSIPAGRDEEGSTSTTTTPLEDWFRHADAHQAAVAEHRAYIARVLASHAGEPYHSNPPPQGGLAAEDINQARPAQTSHQASPSHTPFGPGAPGFPQMQSSAAAMALPPLDDGGSEEEFPMRANVAHCWQDWRGPALQREREQRARMAAAAYEMAESEVELTPQRAYAEGANSDGASSSTTAVDETELWRWHIGSSSDPDAPAAPTQQEPFRSSDSYPMFSVSVEEVAGEDSDSMSAVDFHEYDRGMIAVHPSLLGPNLESPPRAQVRAVRRRLVRPSTGLRSPTTEMEHMDLDSGNEADVEEGGYDVPEEDWHDVPESESGGQSSSRSREVDDRYEFIETEQAGVARGNRWASQRRGRYWCRSDVTN
ncbi:hypothetical protein LZ554_009259 [Drepanopeziza brunnea f. sp. 'monogermtubi']|nr:hypothetical protein LZ554_009259 [Drepanopeziza brunnea f. sp. 'monogermtubi']